jgi:cellulose synthase/poly-beta-1,6-N-acetylglucosamine synthase-like glycosyltransferase
VDSITTGVVLASLTYMLVIYVRSRRRPPVAYDAPPDLLFVVMVPCLNEEIVIGRSLERLAAIPNTNVAVLVIDDGSDDATADVVRAHAETHERVWLFSRQPPEARQGKGEALNAAYRHLLTSDLLAGRRPQDVVVGILDADGRIEPGAFLQVAPYFRDPTVGAVQIGVRMYNKDVSILARMQDLEFVTFTEIFQRGRQRLGSVGLGGNGQFTRLSALATLGDAPWTACLTEDLDLGLRLWAGGHTNAFCPSTHVNQQAVTTVRRLLRQRSRWFQGHLQCWVRIPMVLRADRPLTTRADLVQHLLSPLLLLLMTFPTALFAVALVAYLVTDPVGLGHALTAHHGMWIAIWYLLSFGLAPAYAYVYWLRTPDVGFFRALGYAHLFTLYSYQWMVAGWWAVSNVLRRRSGWAKTARTPDAGAAPPVGPSTQTTS